MKQVHPNYTFVASTKTITLTGLNIAQDQLLLITNATRGVIYYNFASSSHRAVVTAGANTTVVLTDASTTGHADSDQLVIHYDDQLSTQTIAGTVTANTNLPNFGALDFSGATLVTDATVSFSSGQILWAGANANQSISLAPVGTKGRAFLVRFFNDGSAGATLQGQFFGPGSLTGSFNNSNPSFRVEPAGRGWNNSPIAVSADNISTYYLFVAGLRSASESGGATHEILPFNLNFGVYHVSGTGYGRIAIYKIDVPPELALNSVIHGNLKSWLLSPTVTANAGTGTFAVSAASLPLPSGAATSANQATANTSLSNIDTDIGALADSAATTDTGSFSLISLFKRLLQRITTLVPANLTVSSTRLLVDGSGVTQPISGTVTASLGNPTDLVGGGYASLVDLFSNDTIAVRELPAISGTVTAASDKGSVSEASTQSITTGGTHQQVFDSNPSRKYLLIQNISDTDMYLGLGFNPSNTTPAGLLLAKSGGGIVFESSYIPTSEVRIVCATTGKRFVALQG